MYPPLCHRPIEVEAVDCSRARPGDEFVLDVVEHVLARSLARVAVAAAVSGVDADYIVLVDLEGRHYGMGFYGAVCPNDFGVVGGAFETAVERPRPVLVSRVG